MPFPITTRVLRVLIARSFPLSLALWKETYEPRVVSPFLFVSGRKTLAHQRAGSHLPSSRTTASGHGLGARLTKQLLDHRAAATATGGGSGGATPLVERLAGPDPTGTDSRTGTDLRLVRPLGGLLVA